MSSGRAAFIRVGSRVVLCLAAGAAALVASRVVAAPPGPEEVDRFEREVRPVLEQHCHRCHSHAADRIRAGLVLDSLAGMLRGGDSGPAVVPGRSADSLLVRAVAGSDPEVRMPPKGPAIPAGQAAALAAWVDRGAPWPGVDPAAPAPEGASAAGYTREERDWWAFRPVSRPEVPGVPGTGLRNPVDRFLQERRAAAGLQPAPEAPREVLIRRLTFDLTGLPPTPEEVDAFAADRSPDAHGRLVDRLLASPRYGERAARAWLDLVRYAESDGYRVDEYRPNAWRYRDWVVAAFNGDLPYDRFVQAQLAGDELWPGDPQLARVATAFLRHGIYEYNNRDVRGQWEVMLDDLTDTAGDVFLAMGFQCAKCHDHKFDPIRQADYFRLRSFFAPVLPRDDLPVATAAERSAHELAMRAWESATRELREEIDALERPYREAAVQDARDKFNDDVRGLLDIPLPERTPLEHQLAALAHRQVAYQLERVAGRIQGEDKARRDVLLRRLREFDVLKPPPLPQAFTVTDVGPVAPPVHLPRRRDGAPVEPGWPGVLDASTPEIVRPPGVPQSTGRRSALARWLTRPDHPLTARVIVNRVWQQHFGRGLAGNPSDFGRLGEVPTHPELLDWLAAWFVDEGWSLKALHRLLVTSAAYRQASSPGPAALERGMRVDPENRLVWHQPVRRLEAEQIRDAILGVTGELDPVPGGPAVDPSRPRRTLYTRVLRNHRDPLLDVFDAPESFTSVSRRNTTTTPLQALLLVNSPFMEQRARALARRLAAAAPDDAGRVEAAYRMAFGRRPGEAEAAGALDFLRRQRGTRPARVAGPGGLFTERMPHRGGDAAVLTPGSSQSRLTASTAAGLPDDVFTVESVVLARSVSPGAAVRTIASRWSGNRADPGWSLGLTGLGSSFRPGTLVLELSAQGEAHYEAVFAGPVLQLNQPYYVAVSVRVDDPGPAGVVFHVKDLANDCEPVTSVAALHSMVRPVAGDAPLVLGDQAGGGHPWDGLVDEVRISAGVLEPAELLVHGGTRPGACAAWWRLDPGPDPWADASPAARRLVPPASGTAADLDPGLDALADLAHVLLSSNEFVYVD